MSLLNNMTQDINKNKKMKYGFGEHVCNTYTQLVF